MFKNIYKKLLKPKIDIFFFIMALMKKISQKKFQKK